MSSIKLKKGHIYQLTVLNEVTSLVIFDRVTTNGFLIFIDSITNENSYFHKSDLGYIFNLRYCT